MKKNEVRSQKSGVRILMAACAALLTAVPLRAQPTNPPPIEPPPSFLNFNWLTNLPLQRDFTLAKGELSIAPVLINGQLENENIVRDFIKTNYVLGISAGISPSSAVINRISLHAGYRHVWPNAEILIEGIGRRNWQTDAAGIKPSFQGGINLEANWVPVTGASWMIGTGVKFMSADKGKVFAKPPVPEITIAKFTWLF